MFAENFTENKSEKKQEREHLTKHCYYFSSKTGCRFGSKCRFKHEVLNSNAAPQSTDNVIDSFVSLKLDQNNEVAVKLQELSVAAESHVADISQSEVPEAATVKVALISEGTDNESVQVCYHFSRFGWCRFGKRCKYSHPKRAKAPSTVKPPKKELTITDSAPTCTSSIGIENDPQSEQKGSVNDEDIQSEISQHQVEENPFGKRKKKIPTCRFFLKGHCRLGARCRFAHSTRHGESTDTDSQCSEPCGDSPSGLAKLPVEGSHIIGPGPSIRGQRYSGKNVLQRPNPARSDKPRSDLTTAELKQIRKTECDQLKKRFPKGKLEILTESDGVNRYNVEFVPTDPDWPFDIKVFKLQVSVPGSYPLSMFAIELLDGDETLPATVQRYIEVTLAEWLCEKQDFLVKSDKVQLVFRPFLRWLDRQMEDIVTESLRQYQRELTAKAAGFEFIPAKAPAEQRNIILDNDGDTAAHVERQRTDNSESETDEESGSESSESGESDTKPAPQQDFTNVDRKGTEVLLKSLQLKDNTATLLFQKIVIVIQCTRCKNTTEFSTPGGRLNSIPCIKCNNAQALLFRPAMAHQFSAVIGYLDLDGCQPYDLVLQDCLSDVGCMNCAKEMKLEGLVPGQVKQFWCQRCHQKLTIATESVRFQQLQPSDLSRAEAGVHQVKVSRVNKVIRDPAIQEGKPLPGEGTCKHYKKSFRWLRFPCCGKCYPCDICHDDKEGDHEMKFANRMICGFCCKEQPYTVEKPCQACGSQLTKTSTSHWEGGHGCRDKVKMSRNDVHKYANTNKTVSKKTQEKEEAKTKKKTTKLRHT